MKGISIVHYPEMLKQMKWTKKEDFVTHCNRCKLKEEPERKFFVYDTRVVCIKCLLPAIEEAKESRKQDAILKGTFQHWKILEQY